MAFATKKQDHPMVGNRAPTFTLENGAGKQTTLGDLIRHGEVVLYFYPKDMTPGCTKEACDFRDSSSAFKKAGAQVIGISGDSAESHQKFADKYTLTFPLLSDPDRKVAKAYGVWQKKSLYGRQFMGIVRTTFLIDRKGVVRRVFPKVRVEGHASAVVDALREIKERG